MIRQNSRWLFWPKCEPFVSPEGAREPTELGYFSDHLTLFIITI